MPPWLMQLLGGPIIQKLLDYIPDPAERARQQFALQQEMMAQAAKAEEDQRDIDKTEASSGSVFVAGWRPATGWLCVFTLGWSWVFAPLVSWTVMATGAKVAALPVLGTADSQTLLYALLGIGGLHVTDNAIPHVAAAFGGKK